MGHTFTNHLFHVVFSTRDREPWLRDDCRRRLYDYLGGIAHNHAGIPLGVNGTEDHVHLLVRLSPDVAVSDFLRDLKANSSSWLHETFQGLAGFAWQSGYGSFSVSESRWRQVANYIARQGEHHRRMSFAEELAALLTRHGVAFDREHYLD
jgi:putative transposase